MDISGKITILGTTGMLGYAVSEYFKRKNYNVRLVTQNEYDITRDNYKKLQTIIESSKVVINCIGIIKQIIENIPVPDVWLINAVFPKNLAKLCSASDIPLIHVTTDCVYSGEKGNYSEDDLFDPVDLYGVSKLGGETHECMTLRTSIIGPEKDSSRSLLGWAFSKKGTEINGFTNHLWNGVTTLYFAELVEKIFTNDLYQNGIYHIYSKNAASKYELLKMFNDIFELKMKINECEAEQKIDRSLTSKYALSANVVTKTIEEQVRDLKFFFNL